MNIAKLNDVFSTRGAAAALASAEAAQMDDWIIDKLRAGTWVPMRRSTTAAKPEPKPAPVFAFRDVDHKEDTFLVKVDRDGHFYGYIVEERGESGEVIFARSLGRTTLVQAREVIGKSISHPAPAKAGVKTNDPSISRSMKGSSTGGGNKKGK